MSGARRGSTAHSSLERGGRRPGCVHPVDLFGNTPLNPLSRGDFETCARVILSFVGEQPTASCGAPKHPSHQDARGARNRLTCVIPAKAGIHLLRPQNTPLNPVSRGDFDSSVDRSTCGSDSGPRTPQQAVGDPSGMYPVVQSFETRGARETGLDHANKNLKHEVT